MIVNENWLKRDGPNRLMLDAFFAFHLIRSKAEIVLRHELRDPEVRERVKQDFNEWLRRSALFFKEESGKSKTNPKVTLFIIDSVAMFVLQLMVSAGTKF